MTHSYYPPLDIRHDKNPRNLPSFIRESFVNYKERIVAEQNIIDTNSILADDGH